MSDILFLTKMTPLWVLPLFLFAVNWLRWFCLLTNFGNISKSFPLLIFLPLMANLVLDTIRITALFLLFLTLLNQLKNNSYVKIYQLFGINYHNQNS